MPDGYGIHTCHDECPCHTGGKPLADFIDGAPLELHAIAEQFDVLSRAALAPSPALVEENARLRRDLERAVETRENANRVSVRVELENARLQEKYEDALRQGVINSERVSDLEEAICEYMLWEPGRRGHAAAHRRLMDAVNRKDAE